MSTKYNSNEPDGFGFLYQLVYDVRFQSSTFTPALDYELDYLILKGKRNGSPGNVYADIYAVDVDHKPTGASLGQATVVGSTISTVRGEHTWTFGTPVSLSSGIEYAIVVSQPDTNTPNRYEWEYNGNTAGYYAPSYNAGVTWNMPTTSTGCWFQAWGTEASGPLPPINPSPNDDVINVVLSPTLTWEEGV